MAVPRPTAKLDFDSYLSWEMAQPEKHEFARGDIDARRVECFRRDAEDHGVLYEYSGGGASCQFASLDFAWPLTEAFEDVDAIDTAESATE